MNKLVVHLVNGEIVKGYSSNFAPLKPSFHLKLIGEGPVCIEKIFLDKLKAVFFVNSFIGDSSTIDSHDFTQVPLSGKHMIVHFYDDEKFYGVSETVHSDRAGFFLNPIDPNSNIIRAFVINSFIEKVEFVD